MNDIDYFGMDEMPNNDHSEVMNDDLIVDCAFDYENVLNDGKEKNPKLCISVRPSKDISQRFRFGHYQCTHICLVIDNSESMYRIVDYTGFERTGETRIGEDGKKIYIGTGGLSKIDIAVASAKKISELLRDGDTVDCVTYSDQAKVIFEALGVNDQDSICNGLDHLGGFGKNTNISAGLEKAGEVLGKYEDAFPKVVLFFTDGEPTGNDTVENNNSIGKALSEKGIVIESMGLGKDDVNFENLMGISKPSGGFTSMINYPDEFEEIFNSQFVRAQSTIITNVKMDLTLKAGTKVSDYYRGTPDNQYLGTCDGNTISFTIGQVERTQEYRYYFDMTVPGQDSNYDGPINTSSVTIKYQIPSEYGNEEFRVKKDIPIHFTSDTSLCRRVDGNINALFRQAEVKKFDEERRRAYDRGDKDEVIKNIKKIIEVYIDLQKTDEIKAYEHMLKEYMETNKITKATLNKATSSSSKAQESGILEDLEDEELSKFSERLRRRRKR